MAAEDSAVAMQFVDDDVPEIFEQARPSRMVRQDSGVQHVRIAQHHMALFANGLARIAGSIAIVSKYPKPASRPL